MKNGRGQRGWLAWKKIEQAADEQRRRLHSDRSSRALRLLGGRAF